MSSAHEPLPLSDIPTISLLYKLKKLSPAEDTEDLTLPEPNSTYNDKISVIRHDITNLAVDSIVNAANESLLGGGGVDGAIHRAAGPELLEECETLDGCDTGDAKITEGYELPAKKVIHAVGPVYWITKKQGRHTELLSGCYRRSLELAVENNLKSIAFSALSTGVYGYPSGEASLCALETVRNFMDEGKADNLERVIFCNFLPKDENAYFENIPKFFPPIPPSIKGPEDTEKVESTEGSDIASRLPDAPTTEPTSAEEPSPKKQKLQESTAEDITEEPMKEKVSAGASSQSEVKAKADL